MQHIKLALFQLDLKWEDKKTNLENIEHLIACKTEEDCNIIVLPEMFTTGFIMNPKHFAENMEDETIDWMKRTAVKRNAVITGSLIIKENDQYYNRLIWMPPDGNYSHYDKRHLFSMAGEDHQYAAGNKKLIVEYMGWKFCPVICYDLRFPVWLRNKENYDCLLVVANWPERRIQHWNQLLIARAIENQAYAVGVNRTGNDNNQINHNGSTSVIDPSGKILITLKNKEEVINTVLDKTCIEEVRRTMPFLADMDRFSIDE